MCSHRSGADVSVGGEGSAEDVGQGGGVAKQISDGSGVGVIGLVSMGELSVVR